VHHRYTKSPPDWSDAYLRLLSEEAQRAAMAVGAALRLGADASARSQALLAHFKLALDGGALTLSLKRAEADLLSDQAVRRLEALGALLGLTTRTALI
jgi:exopolyphosphatase / guanosine-5'-triphosphate,3'-diphosphate pyrophosphatase